MRARDIMTPIPAALTPADGVWEAAEIMKYAEVGGVPVVSDLVTLRLVGFITDRDITVRCTARRHGVGCEVREHMTPVPLQTVSPDADVSEVVAKMQSAQVRHLPVVDRDGLLLGIVADEDLAVRLPQREAFLLRSERRTAFQPPVARTSLIRDERTEMVRSRQRKEAI